MRVTEKVVRRARFEESSNIQLRKRVIYKITTIYIEELGD